MSLGWCGIEKRNVFPPFLSFTFLFDIVKFLGFLDMRRRETDDSIIAVGWIFLPYTVSHRPEPEVVRVSPAVFRGLVRAMAIYP